MSVPPASDPNPQALLLARQREYKVAALNAKRAGDLDRARELMRIGKVGPRLGWGEGRGGSVLSPALLCCRGLLRCWRHWRMGNLWT